MHGLKERMNSPIAIQIVDEQDKTIKSLGLQLFVAKTEDKITHIESKDRNQPLRVKITGSEGKIRTVEFSIDDTKGDAVQLLEAMDFIRAPDPSRRLKVYNFKRGKFEISSINAKPKDFDQLRYDFIRSLAIIQKTLTKPCIYPILYQLQKVLWKYLGRQKSLRRELYKLET